MRWFFTWFEGFFFKLLDTERMMDIMMVSLLGTLIALALVDKDYRDLFEKIVIMVVMFYFNRKTNGNGKPKEVIIRKEVCEACGKDVGIEEDRVNKEEG